MIIAGRAGRGAASPVGSLLLDRSLLGEQQVASLTTFARPNHLHGPRTECLGVLRGRECDPLGPLLVLPIKAETIRRNSTEFWPKFPDQANC